MYYPRAATCPRNLHATSKQRNHCARYNKVYMQTSNYIMEGFDMAKSTPLGERTK